MLDHRDTIPAPHPSKLLASDWVQLVFPVLAHVPSSVPSSAENPRYAKWVELQLGNPWARELGQDIQALGGLACSHITFARLQTLAWLHPNIEAALAGAESSLRELDAETVPFAPGIQQWLLPVAAEVEVLRCAALLEAAHEARLHASFLAWQAEEECEKLEFELSRVFASAPRLAPAVARDPARRCVKFGSNCPKNLEINTPDKNATGAELPGSTARG